jgi:acylphosphatase
VIERLEATIRGQVQGVGFRWFVKRHATGLGLHGWVANVPGGSVRVVAEGPTPAIEELVILLRRGPAGAVVTSVVEQRLAGTGDFTEFDIRAGGHAGD